ncbi:MAG TPA: transporter [Lutibacter sp.]
MNKFICAFFVLFTLQHKTQSQTAEPSATINKNILQIEIESTYSIQKIESEKITTWSIPNTLFRYGLLNGLEIQVNIPIIKEQLWENDHLVQSLNKFDNLQVGFSVNLWKEKNIFPEASIMARVILPTDQKFATDNIGKLISLNFSNSISENLIFNYNIGHMQTTDHSSYYFYIANISYLLNSKIHLFIENFADFHNEKLMSHNLNIGGGYNFTDRLIFDISVNKGLNQAAFYTGGRLTWIINTKNN